MDVFHDNEGGERDDLQDLFQHDSPLKIQMDTAWVYAQLAADECRNNNLETARQYQTTAEQAYNEGTTLLVNNPGIISKQRLHEIQFHLQQSRRLLAMH
jgi:hypothetical protein